MERREATGQANALSIQQPAKGNAAWHQVDAACRVVTHIHRAHKTRKTEGWRAGARVAQQDERKDPRPSTCPQGVSQRSDSPVRSSLATNP